METEMSFTAEILIPPTANHIWKKSRRGMYRTKKYTDWIEDSSLMLHAAGLKCFAEPVSVTLTIHGGKGWRENWDIDNRIKPTLDLLRHNAVIQSDSSRHVRAVSAVYVPGKKTDLARCVVSVS